MAQLRCSAPLWRSLARPVAKSARSTLPRLVFGFNRIHFGRLRQLIDRINAAPVE
jgi:hypothetical protein